MAFESKLGDVFLHKLFAHGETYIWIFVHHKLMQLRTLNYIKTLLPFGNENDHIFNKLKLKRVWFSIGPLSTKIFCNCWWVHCLSFFTFKKNSLHPTFNKFCLASKIIFGMFIHNMFFIDVLPWLGLYYTIPFQAWVAFWEFYIEGSTWE